MSWGFELARPWMLLWIGLLIPVAIYYWRSLSDFPKSQRIVSLLIRSLILALAVFALSGLTFVWPSDRVHVVVLMDGSESVDGQALELAESSLQSIEAERTSNAISYLKFADRVTNAVTRREELPELAATERMATNLAMAIDAGVGRVQAGYVPHLLLLSDGRETTGNAVQAALNAKVPISVIALSPRQDPEVQIAEVVVPPQVRQGEPFYVEVVVASNHADTGFVDVFRDDVLINDQAEEVKLELGETRFRFRQTIDDAKQVSFMVRLRDFEDRLLDNNQEQAVVYAAGKPTVLIVDTAVDQTQDLKWALEEQGISVQTRPDEGIPNSLAELQLFDCILLSNVPALSMSNTQMELLRTYVQDLGGGLIMLGGDQSFGLGGYYKTVLEEILPVRSNFEKEKEKSSLAMVLVIDKSGSMGGEKMELAKDAAKGTAELLGPRDYLGVIAFDGASYWVSELTSASNHGEIIQRISTIEASGGTNIYPGLVDAHDALNRVSAKLKHVILLTDGHSNPGDYNEVVRRMVESRVTLSCVAVGAEADTSLLEQLARSGDGRYYFCDSPQSIPQIFAKETVTASKQAINEAPFLPQLVRPHAALKGIDLENAPFLLGYVVTRPKPTCELILATETGEPLLAWWRYGLGVSVAFTSDAKNQWASEWLNWPQYGTFWAQLIRHAMRKSEAKGVFIEVERSAMKSRVVLNAVDELSRFVNEGKGSLKVIGPGMQQELVSLLQTAPGRYEGEFATESRGAYQLQIEQTRRDGEQILQSRALTVGYPDELRLGPAQTERLAEIAKLSGGVVNPTATQIWSPGNRKAWQAMALWKSLLTAALCLFVLDVALRRIEFFRGRTRKWA